MPINYGKHFISDEDIESVVNVLKSDFLTQGPTVKTFEKDFAKLVGSKYAVAVCNGTAALHLAALSLGCSQDDTVLTTPITFAASANCIRYCGGKVDFVDIDERSFCMDLDKLEEKLDQNPKAYSGIVIVDYAGYPVDMERLRRLANKYNFWVVEDACHAPGAEFKDSQGDWNVVGNCKYSDLTVFSFHPVKHIAMGEGGLITTNDESLYQKLCLLRSHGITKDPNILSKNDGGWYQEMIELGYNYRLTDMQAALGSSQLKRHSENVIRRQAIADRYDKLFAGLELICPFRSESIKHAFHLYVIQVEDRKGLYDYLTKHEIYAQVHYVPVHQMPYYKKTLSGSLVLEVAEKFYESCLSLPMYPTLTQEEQDFVVEKVKEFLDGKGV